MKFYVIVCKVGEMTFYRAQGGTVWSCVLDNADIYTWDEIPPAFEPFAREVQQ